MSSIISGLAVLTWVAGAIMALVYGSAVESFAVALVILIACGIQGVLLYALATLLDNTENTVQYCEDLNKQVKTLQETINALQQSIARKTEENSDTISTTIDNSVQDVEEKPATECVEQSEPLDNSQLSCFFASINGVTRYTEVLAAWKEHGLDTVPQFSETNQHLNNKAQTERMYGVLRDSTEIENFIRTLKETLH